VSDRQEVQWSPQDNRKGRSTGAFGCAGSERPFSFFSRIAPAGRAAVDGEAGIAAGLPVEHFPKRRTQPVGLAVAALQLIDRRLQRVASAIPPQGNFLRPVSPQDQDPASCQAPAQVEQQADRAQVRPLQVILHQKQGRSLRHGVQDPCVLLEQIALRQAGSARTGGGLPLQKLLQALFQSALPGGCV
jgi:hypothetical protein